MAGLLAGLACVCIWLWVNNSLEKRIADLERRVSVLDDPFAPPPVGLDAPPHRER